MLRNAKVITTAKLDEYEVNGKLKRGVIDIHIHPKFGFL